MSPKNLVLAAASVAVLAMGVYLFVQVRATPAQASATATPPAPAEPPPPERFKPTPRPPVHERKSPTVVEVTRARPAISTPQRTPDPGLQPVLPSEADRKVDVKKDAVMDQANKAYDRQDFDEAMAIAAKVLEKDPTNVRMLRIMVSASCISGDPAVAQTAYEKLPKFDREQMKQRCDRYGVTFKDP